MLELESLTFPCAIVQQIGFVWYNLLYFVLRQGNFQLSDTGLRDSDIAPGIFI